MAITALVLGIISVIVFPLAPVALILGIIALVRINNRRAELRGGGLAIASICLGAIVTLMIPLLIGIMLPAFAAARGAAMTAVSMNNLRQIAAASSIYSDNFSGHLPPDVGTLAVTMDVPARVFVRPDTDKTPPTDAAAVKAWVNQNTDYIYLGGGQTRGEMTTSNAILAYEKPTNPPRRRTAIVYAEARTEQLDTADALRKVQSNR